MSPFFFFFFFFWFSGREEFNEGIQHVCNFSQSIRDIRYASLTWLLGMKVEVYQLLIFPTSLRTSSSTSGGPLALAARLLYKDPCLV
jgi:hypothetical protein